ncbi:uncharacterized protein LOC122858616 [Aphidius gifuensis]|uniref:uncharacterized protein LOC122858616 n=1 Tax=Aphidius gifuensis TaxID=684658 RepID=UPI001CDBBEB0|nr:uncharacterized protein LOC122858616 [Aphidius gifuensis]
MSQTLANRSHVAGSSNKWHSAKGTNNNSTKKDSQDCPCCWHCSGGNEIDNQSSDAEISSQAETLADENIDEISTEDEYTDEADYDTGKRCKAKLCNDSQDDDDESITKTIKPSKAVNAIEKLRELQWRRDQLERHYTFGIRRIIDEVYFPDGMINGSKKKTSSKFNERRKVSSGRSRLDEEKPILIELPCGCLHHCRRFQQDDLPSEISRRNLSSKSTLQNCTTKIKGKSCANFNCDDENSKIFRRTLSGKSPRR